jgi:hypothetical protein
MRTVRQMSAAESDATVYCSRRGNQALQFDGGHAVYAGVFGRYVANSIGRDRLARARFAPIPAETT